MDNSVNSGIVCSFHRLLFITIIYSYSRKGGIPNPLCNSISIRIKSFSQIAADYLGGFSQILNSCKVAKSPRFPLYGSMFIRLKGFSQIAADYFGAFSQILTSRKDAKSQDTNSNHINFRQVEQARFHLVMIQIVSPQSFIFRGSSLVVSFGRGSLLSWFKTFPIKNRDKL